ncbi:hypothetical protein BED47_18105 [Gottfriedia luciferensis]|uniref:HTH lysR-type domain-containing protein n=1 Tax=Gottfriedia luciferensis TaxID=178774 RepID=A0ABX2ZVX9_9BACI|nr:LysR family transcriptional regulator [Gottfriedia luciferensis]ODG92830.1 hypothetical protein BED47_18105 [Gottfriedia luciferensis]
MYLEKINYLIEVAKEKSIIKTAEKLHTSPSVISQFITQMEKEWGLKIFTRTKTGTIPTEEGQVVIRKAAEILSKYEEMKEEINVQANLSKTILKIAYVPSVTNVVFDSILELKRESPEIDVYMYEMGPMEVLANIKSGKSDLGLLPINEFQLKSEVDINYKKIYEGKLCICVGKDSPLRSYELLTPENLINEKFALYDGWHVKRIFDLFFDEVNILFSATNTEIIKNAVIEGLAITLTYDKTLDSDINVLTGKIFTIPIELPNFNPNPIWYIQANNKPVSSITKRFLQLLKKEIE